MRSRSGSGSALNGAVRGCMSKPTTAAKARVHTCAAFPAVSGTQGARTTVDDFCKMLNTNGMDLAAAMDLLGTAMPAFLAGKKGDKKDDAEADDGKKPAPELDADGKPKPRKPPAFAAHFDTQPGTGRTLSLCVWLNEGWTPAQGGHLRVFPAPLLHVDVEPLCDRAAIFCSHHMLHRVRPLQFVKVNPVYLLD